MSEAHAHRQPDGASRVYMRLGVGDKGERKGLVRVKSAMTDLPQYHRDQVGEARRIADGWVPVRDDEHQPVCTRIERTAAAQLKGERRGAIGKSAIKAQKAFAC